MGEARAAFKITQDTTHLQVLLSYQSSNRVQGAKVPAENPRVPAFLVANGTCTPGKGFPEKLVSVLCRPSLDLEATEAGRGAAILWP